MIKSEACVLTVLVFFGFASEKRIGQVGVGRTLNSHTNNKIENC